MNNEPTEEKDVTEDIVHQMHIVLPVAGAILMFLLAFIAITMAQYRIIKLSKPAQAGFLLMFVAVQHKYLCRRSGVPETFFNLTWSGVPQKGIIYVKISHGYN